MNLAVEWSCASAERKSRWAADAGLIRHSAFSSNLPHWEALPAGWREKIEPVLRATVQPTALTVDNPPAK